MPAQTAPITERQLDLITRAHCDASGLIEPLLTLKGGAKLKMIASLAQRGLIAQTDSQWRITPEAIALITGNLPQGHDMVAPQTPMVDTAANPLGQYDIPTFLAAAPAAVSASFELDADTEQIVAQAEAQWQTEKAAQVSGDAYDRAVVCAKEGTAIRKTQEAARHAMRASSKQAQVLEMLRRPKGTTIDEIMAVTGWQAHTVRGTFAATFKKRLGLDILSEKTVVDGVKQRRYRIENRVA